MTTWDDYVTDTDVSEEIGDAQATVGAAEEQAILAGDVEATDELAQQYQSLGDAADSAEAAEWEAATGDEAAFEAERYLTAAQTDAAEGFPDAAEQMLTDAGMYADVAEDSYAQAGAEYDSAAESVEEAGSYDTGGYDAGSYDDSSGYADSSE